MERHGCRISQNATCSSSGALSSPACSKTLLTPLFIILLLYMTFPEGRQSPPSEISPAFPWQRQILASSSFTHAIQGASCHHCCPFYFLTKSPKSLWEWPVVGSSCEWLESFPLQPGSHLASAWSGDSAPAPPHCEEVLSIWQRCESPAAAELLGPDQYLAEQGWGLVGVQALDALLQPSASAGGQAENASSNWLSHTVRQCRDRPNEKEPSPLLRSQKPLSDINPGTLGD
ncbi:hypothetical protein AOLI_G00317480 [Acnodon oligacanthus]